MTQEWFGETDGYAFIEIRGETQEQIEKVFGLIPPMGCYLEATETPEGRLKIQVTPKPIAEPDQVEKEPVSEDGKPVVRRGRSRRAYNAMKLEDLKAMAAENGLESKDGDKRPDLIRLLQEADLAGQG